MVWVLSLIVLVIAVVLSVVFLNRYYAKAGAQSALIRTGWGGQKIVAAGGCLNLPIVHRLESVSMRTMRFGIARKGAQSLMTRDKVRVEVEMAFYVRVARNNEAIVRAAQALGTRGFNVEDIAQLLEGKLIASMQNIAAGMTMEEIHENRSGFRDKIIEELQSNIDSNGLELESASLISFDQAAFSSLDDQNIFNAIGMRHVAEQVATHRKSRVETEAQADIAIRTTKLTQAREQIKLEQEQRSLEIAQTEAVAKMQARSDADLAKARALSEREIQDARITRETQVKSAEITRDQDLREKELAAIHALEEEKLNNAIALAAKRGAEAQAQAQSEAKRADVVLAIEEVERQKAIAVANRTRELAIMRAAEKSEVLIANVKSETESVLARAKASAGAKQAEAEAEKIALKARAEGNSALANAENDLSEQSARLRLEMHKLDKLPEIYEQMVKPAEKIDSIKINQIGGSGFSNGQGDQNGGAFDQALNSILGMSVQFPAMKKLGEEIGIDMDPMLATRAQDSIMRSVPSPKSAGAKATAIKSDSNKSTPSKD